MKVIVVKVFCDWCMEMYLEGKFDLVMVLMVKYWVMDV